MTLRTVAVIASLALMTAVPVAALAAPGDPERGSPSGAVYDLPLDDGRGDAAPHSPGGSGSGEGSGGGTGGGGSDSGTSGSGTGSSGSGTDGSAAQTAPPPPVDGGSQPAGGGSQPAGGGSQSSSAGSGGSGGNGSSQDQQAPGDPDSLYRSENNFGSSSQVPGDPRDPGQTDQTSAPADSGNTSTGTALLLIGMLAVAGLAAGLVAAHRRRLST